MIQPRPRKPHAQNEGRDNAAQAFVKIRAVLLGNRVHQMRPIAPQVVAQRIHIADNRAWDMPQISQRIRPAIGRNQHRGQRQRRFDVRQRRISAPDQRDALRAVYKCPQFATFPK